MAKLFSSEALERAAEDLFELIGPDGAASLPRPDGAPWRSASSTSCASRSDHDLRRHQRGAAQHHRPARPRAPSIIRRDEWSTRACTIGSRRGSVSSWMGPTTCGWTGGTGSSSVTPPRCCPSRSAGRHGARPSAQDVVLKLRPPSPGPARALRPGAAVPILRALEPTDGAGAAGAVVRAVRRGPRPRVLRDGARAGRGVRAGRPAGARRRSRSASPACARG